MDSQVVVAIDEAMGEFCKMMGNLRHGGYIQDGGIRIVDCRPTAWLGFVYRACLDDLPDTTILQVKTEMQNGVIPPFWLVGPRDLPEDLAGHLEQHGLREMYKMTGMALELEPPDERLAPDGYELRVLTTLDEVDRWSSVVSEALFGGAVVEPSLYGALLASPVVRFIGAFRGDLLVGTSLVVTSGGVANVNMVSTLPDHRRRGLGAALTHSALMEGRKLGCSLGVLQASSMGEPVYKAMGFVEHSEYRMFGL